MGSHISPLDNWISNGNTNINKPTQHTIQKHRYPICGPPFFLKFFNSSLLWNVFIINSVEQLQTLPKTQSEIDISPFLKTQKPSILYSYYISNSNHLLDKA
jgi:hypothetical protein